jgi:hypothetical protein
LRLTSVAWFPWTWSVVDDHYISSFISIGKNGTESNERSKGSRTKKKTTAETKDGK